MPLGHVSSMLSTMPAEPNPKCTRLSLEELYPTVVVAWLYCVPREVVSLTLVPRPSRLDLTPTNFRMIQWFRLPPFWVPERFIHTSGGPFRTVTTASILPSLLRSPKAAPRCAAGTENDVPAFELRSSKVMPPLLRNT